MSNNIGQELLRIKTKLEKEKNAKLELQGELKSVMKQLKDDFGISNIAQAEELLATLEKEIQDAEEQLQKQINRIRQLMEGSGNDE